jgi:LacI family transcriptional regulator/LacI family repressor for deo operon, udp, cdd, tsx, nupC, and nupG
MASLTDIARAARVSIATVSRVINEPGVVREDTRSRVRRAIERLHFQPNRVARRLRQRNGRRRLIGLVIPEIGNPHFADIVRGVEDAAYAEKFAVMLCNADDNLEKERFYFDILRAESVDGVIVPPIQDSDPVLLEALANKLPLIAIDRRLKNLSVDSISVDNRHGAEAAVEHLISRGYRSIAHIAGPQLNFTSRERKAAWSNTLVRHGLMPRKEHIWWGTNQHESGVAGAESLLSLRNRPRAIFVANNLMAAGALEVISRRGLKVPDDIAIVGFDDPPWAKWLRPALTTVRQPTHEMGRLAFSLLLRRLNDPKASVQHIVLPTELMIRESS